jgi:hypothetical protein
MTMNIFILDKILLLLLLWIKLLILFIATKRDGARKYGMLSHHIRAVDLSLCFGIRVGAGGPSCRILPAFINHFLILPFLFIVCRYCLSGSSDSMIR